MLTTVLKLIAHGIEQLLGVYCQSATTTDATDIADDPLRTLTARTARQTEHQESAKIFKTSLHFAMCVFC